MTERRLTTPDGRELAYHKTDGQGPCVVFLGGFMSDMSGTKALYLEDWARSRAHGFLRFDYSGHGQSSGRFEDGCISDWARDAKFVITKQTSGKVILVGSSMGGWISLLLARQMPEKIAGLVTIALPRILPRTVCGLGLMPFNGPQFCKMDASKSPRAMRMDPM